MKSFFPFLFILTLWGGVGQARPLPQVVLLTSVPEPVQKSIWRPKNWHLAAELEKTFRRTIENSGFRWKVVHNADQFQLHQELMDTTNIAVFWVSHAGDGDDSGKALGAENLIADKDANNVKEVFQQIHPHLQYLAVVGCGAESFVQDYQKAGYFPANLHVMSFPKRIDAISGLKQALDQSVIDLNAAKLPKGIGAEVLQLRLDIERWTQLSRQAFDSTLPLKLQPTRQLMLSRQIPLDEKSGLSNAARVLMSGHLLAVFPAGKPGEIQHLSVPLSSFGSEILFISGASRSRNLKIADIGGLEIDSSQFVPGKWKLFSRGVPEMKLYEFISQP